MTVYETEITREFQIEAAHQLPHVPPGHKCGRMHGHNFRVIVTVRGPVDAHTGFIVDYATIEEAFAPLFDQIDHRCLNDIKGLENPTSENLAAWVLDRLRLPAPARVYAVCVKENSETSATAYAPNPKPLVFG